MRRTILLVGLLFTVAVAAGAATPGWLTAAQVGWGEATWPTNQTPPAATPTPRPAPAEDRVGYPDNYQSTYTLYFSMDRPDVRQVRDIYANDKAASTKPGEAYPYGSIFVMETWSIKLDDAKNPIFDDKGRYQKDQLTTIFVQRKEPGFGVEYEAARSGEWEYVAYRPDRSYAVTSRNSAACALCHLQQAGAAKDYIFRASLFHTKNPGAIPKGLMQHYLFIPETIAVPVGATVTWYNDDEVFHTVTAADRSFDSKIIATNASFSHTFTQAGSYDYLCALHPAMKAKIVVGE